MKNKLMFQRLLTALFVIILLICNSWFILYMVEWVTITALMPSDCEKVTAKAYDWEVIKTRHDEEDDIGESCQYRFTYEYTVDGNIYILSHDTNYLDETAANNNEVTVYYQKSNPELPVLFSAKGYSELVDKKLTFHYEYSESIFENSESRRLFYVFAGSVALAAIVIFTRYYRIKKIKR